MFGIFTQLKQQLINWCLTKKEVQVGDLHSRLQSDVCEIYNNDELKFIEQTSRLGVLVETPTGYSKIIHTHKTVPYTIFELKTENNVLLCADEHIVITAANNEIFVKDLSPKDLIKTKQGLEEVISVETVDMTDNMYDIELDDENHVYYTNNILSHNSVTSAAYLLWFAMFNKDKTVLIAANKNDNAMEMILRIRYAYEELPMWLKAGIRDDGYNKHEIGFDNGSRIVSTATSENSGRGMSISLLFLDEFAFVKPNIQKEFWTSISPTLATGGSAILTSTPNGDLDIYSSVWRAANVGSVDGGPGSNGYIPIYVGWEEPPNRDEKFKREETSRIGERRWRQEYECCHGNTMVEIEDMENNVVHITMVELYNKLQNNDTLV